MKELHELNFCDVVKNFKTYFTIACSVLSTCCYNSHSKSLTVALCWYSTKARAVVTEAQPLAITLRLWQTRVHITTVRFTTVV